MASDQSRPIGHVRVEGGTLLVTDPCYIPNSLRDGLVALIDGFPDGRHPVSIVLRADRVAEIRLETRAGSWFREERVADVGVDSGQIAMLSLTQVPDWESDEESVPAGMDFREACAAREGSFGYRGVCHLTLSDDLAGTIGDRVAACESGYGDGVYPVVVRRDSDGTVVRVSVLFLDEDDGDVY